MNHGRRKEIQKARELISSVVNLLERILSDEEEAFDSMPESLQSSDNGMASEEAQGLLNDAIDALEEAVGCLEDI